jgi:nitrogen fixation NifU-like protein
VIVSNQERLTDYDRIFNEIQRQLLEQARKIYSPQVIEHAYHPRNLGRMDGPDAFEILHGMCGDTMEIYLRLNVEQPNEEIITDVSFMTDGCGPSIACGSMLTAMVHGMPLEEAGMIEPEDLLAALGGLPEETTHCADLAVATLRGTIANWYRKGHFH